MALSRRSRSSALLVLSVLCLLLLVVAMAPTRAAAAAGKKKKLTEAQLAEIEDQWMEDEEETEDDTPFKYTKGPDGSRQPPPPPAGPKTEMAFVTLKGVKDRKKTDQLAGRWGDQMMSGGIGVRAYTIEDNRILFVCDQRGHKDMNRVRAFLLKQAETEEFEWNSKKSKPGDAVADESDDDSAAAPADPLARFQAMQDEQADKEKRRARKEKKKAEERKRKKRRQREMEEKKKRIAAEKKKAKMADKQKQQQQQQQQQQESASLKTEL